MYTYVRCERTPEGGERWSFSALSDGGVLFEGFAGGRFMWVWVIVLVMKVDASVLVQEIKDDLENVDASVVDSGRVVVSESYTAGEWRYEYFESFVNRVREFIMQYTVEWTLEGSNCNRVEGVHSVVLVRE